MAKSFSKAQAEAINSGFLDTLATAQGYESLSLRGTAKLLFDLAAEFAIGAQSSLNAKDKVASGALHDSIVPVPLRLAGKTVIAEVKVLEYYN